MASISKHFQFKPQKAPLSLRESPPLRSLRTHTVPSLFKQEATKKGVNLVDRVIAPVERPPEAHRIFWALKEDWWKQLFDGDLHQYGPEVFDLGLHGGKVEPGFYGSALSACRFASRPEHIMKAPIIRFYLMLHSIACQHFDGRSTLMKAHKAGRFTSPIDKGINFTGNVFELFRSDPQMYNTTRRKCHINAQYHALGQFLMNEKDANKRLETLRAQGVTIDEAFANHKNAAEWQVNFQKQVKAKIAKINDFILSISTKFGLNHPMSILTLEPENPARIQIRYLCTKEEVDRVVPVVFDEYNKAIAETTSKEKKLMYIALLFQTLEWMHPFNDGQGRTDLILLARELCRNGLNPAILEFPYVSTFSLLPDWVEYLKQGMLRWRKVEAEKNAPPRPSSPLPPAEMTDIDEKEKQTPVR
jgi:hypothetical protein